LTSRQIRLFERVKSLNCFIMCADGAEEESRKMTAQGGSGRALIGFIIGGFFGYWITGNLFVAFVFGVIGALVATRLLD
jgi:hypothetical protein